MNYRCHAKLNLILRVRGRRPDGYHELSMLNVGLDLADEITVEPRPGPEIIIRCDRPEVPTGPDNLCHRAAREFFKTFPQATTGLDVDIKKRVPVAGGLGGGSANAAATLRALAARAARTGAVVSEGALRGVALRVGADVPFFLFRSPAVVAGIGEVLAPGPELPSWILLLRRFDFGVSAASAYSDWDLTSDMTWDTLKSFEEIKQRPEPGTLINDLYPVVAARHPEVAATRAALIEAGAENAMMSGSGPTVFGVFYSEGAAKTAKQKLAAVFGEGLIMAHMIEGPLIVELTEEASTR